jgi:hypothetical protein
VLRRLLGIVVDAIDSKVLERGVGAIEARDVYQVLSKYV